MQSSAKPTGFFRMRASSAATGFSESLASRPFGRPKCASRIALPPFCEISEMVGADAFQPRGVGDAAVFHGNVEVDAQQHALALYVDVIEGAECFYHFDAFSVMAGLVPAIHVLLAARLKTWMRRHKRRA